MAARANESYMGVTYEFGMLNTAGEWLAPLSASHPIVQSGFAFDPHTAWTQQISYAGEGVFLFKIAWNAANGHDCTDGLYDVYSNRAFPYRFHGISSMPAQNVRFVNDQAVLMATGSAITPKLEVLRRDGSVHTLAEFPAKAVGYEVDRRLCISEDRFFTVHSNGWNTLCALWTRQGELVRAFENLTIFPYGTFVDGRAPAILKNELGSLYFTLLNTDGTFAFEPVSISSDAYQLPHMPSPVDENDSIVCFNGRQTILKGKSAYFIYDADGTLLGSFPLQCYYGPYKVAGQNNGVFCIQLNDHLYDYITGSELPAYQ